MRTKELPPFEDLEKTWIDFYNNPTNKKKEEIFYTCYYPHSVAMIANYSNNEQMAEDLAQDMYMKIRRTYVIPQKWKNDNSFRALLATCVYRAFCSWYKKNKKETDAKTLEAEFGASENVIVDTFSIKEIKQLLRKKLSPSKRNPKIDPYKIWELCYLEDYTYPNAAKELGLNVSQIQGQIPLINKALRVIRRGYT